MNANLTNPLYLFVDGEITGPYSHDDVLRMISGGLPLETQVHPGDGNGEWHTLLDHFTSFTQPSQPTGPRAEAKSHSKKATPDVAKAEAGRRAVPLSPASVNAPADAEARILRILVAANLSSWSLGKALYRIYTKKLNRESHEDVVSEFSIDPYLISDFQQLIAECSPSAIKGVARKVGFVCNFAFLRQISKARQTKLSAKKVDNQREKRPSEMTPAEYKAWQNSHSVSSDLHRIRARPPAAHNAPMVQTIATASAFGVYQRNQMNQELQKLREEVNNSDSSAMSGGFF
jgi:hypothetical protein